MSILVIDGMGGGLGNQIVTQLRSKMPTARIVAVGTNSTATANMVKAGANKGATGANAIRVCLQNASCVVGPFGMIMTDALLGEITSEIAGMIGSCSKPRVLIPVAHDDVYIVGLSEKKSMSELVKQAVNRVEEIIGQKHAK